MIKGESYSFVLVFNEEYDVNRIQELQLAIGNVVIGKLSSSTIYLLNSNSYKCDLSGITTNTLRVGSEPIELFLDDSIRGVLKRIIGEIYIENPQNKFNNSSINEEFNHIINLTITETAITVDNVLYDYLKGADGDDGNGIESTELISTVGLVKTYRITYTDATTFDYEVKDGEKGDKGDDGETGAQGLQGIQGLKGDKGDTGSQGIQGVQGLKGDKGDKGDAFTYEDFTPDQILELQAPALQAQEIILQTNEEITQAEAERVSVGLSLQLKIQSDITILTTGDGKYIYTIPAKLNGYAIESIHASLTTASTSGLPQFKVYNLRSAAEILSTNVTIDATEFSSYTALTQHVVNAANKGVFTGDRLRIDCVAAGAGAKGFGLIIKFVKP